MSINSVSNDLASTVNFINAQKPIPPTISGYSVGGLDDTALDPAGGQTVQINGTGFLPGAIITFDGSAVAVVTFVNANQLTFTSPAKSAGTYTIYVVNADGGTAIYIPGVIYSVLPTWTTSAGTLGSYYETTSISNTVVASGDAPITYSLFSGSLPTGATLYANGVITGTAPVDSSSTTYSFTIEAIDAQLQGSTRSFSLTINVDAVTWVSPANNTTYTSAANSAISTVTLSATDAAGYAVSYSANALPTGLSLTGANITGTPTVIADSSTLLTATAATTNRTAVRTINWSITVANDPYFEYNTLLIPGASTTFVDDASTNNFAVTINGDTKPNNFNPYTPGYYSNYFDGNGDVIYATESGGAFTFGTGDYEYSAWIFTTDSGSGQQTIFGRDNTGNTAVPYIYIQPTSRLIGLYYSSVILSGTTAIAANRWYYITVSRVSGTSRIFVNGVLEASAADSANLTAAGKLVIGGQWTGNTNMFLGYISNARVVKGSGVTSVTVPSTPLTAIANTSLLTCQSNRFIDNSTNNFTLTVSGDTKIQSFQPFTPNSSYSTYGSGYFDGTGDYLTLSSNTAFNVFGGDMTIECWFYANSLANSPHLFAFVQDSTNRESIYFASSVLTFWSSNSSGNGPRIATSALSLNTWYHMALVKSGSTFTLYLNGTSVGTSTTTQYSTSDQSLQIGTYNSGSYAGDNYNGYITDVRIVKGTAVYTTTFTPPSAPLTAIANTSLLTLQNNQSVNNNVFLDNSTNNFFVTRNGNTTQGTFSPYGGNWSNYFDGTGDYLTCVGTGAVVRASGSFTIEGWYYPTSSDVSYRAVYSSGTGYETAGRLYQYGTQVVYYTSGSQSGEYGSVSWTINTWNHFAVTWNGTTTKIYINGQLSNTNTLPYSGTTDLSVSEATYTALGYISNFRITSSVLYTSNFTPSTTPLTPTTGTRLLTCQSNRIVDASINNFTVTNNGNTSVQRYSPFNPSSLTPTSYSGYFDGTGDYLSVPDNAAWNYGTGDFTIEFWVLFSAFPSSTWMVQLSQFADANNRISVFFGNNASNENGLVFKAVIAGTTYKAVENDSANITMSSLGYSTSTWYHVAISRSGSSFKGFINGVQKCSLTSSVTLPDLSAPLLIGAYDTTPQFVQNGYISNLRIVKGTALYTTTFTPSTTPLTTTSQGATASQVSLLTLQSPTFIDNSTNNFTITAVGNSQPTQQNPFGFTSATTNGYTVSTIGGSGYFDGSDYLSVPNNAALNLGNNSWTCELWIYPTGNYTTYNTLFAKRNSATLCAYEGYLTPTNGYLGYYNGTLYSSSTAPTTNAWNHVAYVFDGTNIKIYLNGTQVLSSATSNADQAVDLYIGIYNSAGTPFDYYFGYISDFRLVKGTTLYTSNFVPPSAPLTAVQNTALLTNMTSAGIYDAAMMNNMETVGDAKLSTAISKFGGSSMSFDGSGDVLSTAASQNFVFNGDFTVEGWVYIDSTMTSTRPDNLKTFIFMGWNTGNTPQLYVYGNTSTPGIGLGYYDSTSSWEVAVTVPKDQWVHIAYVRTGTILYGFVAGTRYTINASISATIGTNNTMVIAGNPNQVAAYYSYLKGYIDDLRITKGYARYTSNFTPPTTAFPIY